MCLRLRGIDGEAAIIMFKALHNLLPTRDRVDRLSKRQGPLKGICIHCPGVKDDLYHALTQCRRSKPGADLMLQIIRNIHQNAIMFEVIFLQCDTGGLWDLPISWITFNCVHMIWNKRQSGGMSSVRMLAAAFLNTKNRS